MGAFGSGPHHDPARAKPLVESCLLTLDVRVLSRDGALASDGVGEIQIGVQSVAYKITRVPSPVLDLAFIVVDGTTARRVRQRVPLATTRPPFGGRRWWFRCPSCGKAVFKLFLPCGRGHLACRSCHDLTYLSVQVHDDRVCKLRRNPEGVAAIMSGAEAASQTQYVLALKACLRGDGAKYSPQFSS